MKISVITVVFNNASTIEASIRSVQSQQYPHIEHIIVDGGSDDGTLEVIDACKNSHTRLISESDHGLYDAINKGIKMATGDVIGLLHSDDIFNDEWVITNIANAFLQNETESLYADLVYVRRNRTDKVTRHWKSGKFSKKKFNIGWMPPHPTFYVKKEVFLKYGYYDTEFKSAADYELMLRYLYKHEISTFYLPMVLVRMRLGGESNKSLANRILANKEDYQAWKKNKLIPKVYTRFLKPLLKIPQFMQFTRFY